MLIFCHIIIQQNSLQKWKFGQQICAGTCHRIWAANQWQCYMISSILVDTLSLQSNTWRNMPFQNVGHFTYYHQYIDFWPEETLTKHDSMFVWMISVSTLHQHYRIRKGSSTWDLLCFRSSWDYQPGLLASHTVIVRMDDTTRRMHNTPGWAG